MRMRISMGIGMGREEEERGKEEGELRKGTAPNPMSRYEYTARNLIES